MNNSIRCTGCRAWKREVLVQLELNIRGSGPHFSLDTNPTESVPIATQPPFASSWLNCLNLASRGNILIKDGRSLELLHKVDTVIFDKTGTLTQEQPQVKAVHLAANISSNLAGNHNADMNEETVLIFAAAAE